MTAPRQTPASHLDPTAADALANATVTDPFAVLGPHDTPEGRIIRAFPPGALRVEAIRKADGRPFGRVEPSAAEGLFESRIVEAAPYMLRISWPGGVQETEDPYAFGLLLGEVDLYLF